MRFTSALMEDVENKHCYCTVKNLAVIVLIDSKMAESFLWFFALVCVVFTFQTTGADSPFGFKPPIFLIGAQKSGTTELFHSLTQHPQITTFARVDSISDSIRYIVLANLNFQVVTTQDL
jgi:hypothetical protein